RAGLLRPGTRPARAWRLRPPAALDHLQACAPAARARAAFDAGRLGPGECLRADPARACGGLGAVGPRPVRRSQVAARRIPPFVAGRPGRDGRADRRPLSVPGPPPARARQRAAAPLEDPWPGREARVAAGARRPAARWHRATDQAALPGPGCTLLLRQWQAARLRRRPALGGAPPG